MEQIRYFLGVAIFIVIPLGLLYWLIIHLWSGWWRRWADKNLPRRAPGTDRSRRVAFSSARTALRCGSRHELEPDRDRPRLILPGDLDGTPILEAVEHFHAGRNPGVVTAA